MVVGGTLQDSVMSYQLMHMYTALQCRHSGGFTLTFKTELHTSKCTITVFRDYFCSPSSVNPPGCHRLHKPNSLGHKHGCMLKLAFTTVPEFLMKLKIPDTEFFTM